MWRESDDWPGCSGRCSPGGAFARAVWRHENMEIQEYESRGVRVSMSYSFPLDYFKNLK